MAVNEINGAKYAQYSRCTGNATYQQTFLLEYELHNALLSVILNQVSYVLSLNYILLMCAFTTG